MEMRKFNEVEKFGNAMEKTENPEIPTRNARTNVRNEKYRFSRRIGDKQ